MQKHLALTLAIVVSAHALADTATDIEAKKPYSAYLQDSRGMIVRSGTGLCWRTNYWTPADAVIGCDGDLVPPIVSAIAPPIVAQSAPAVVPPPPPPPAPKPCDFSFVLKSDETFSFDNANLSDGAKHGLDTDFRTKLASCNTVQGIVVTGFTDRLGSDAYNMKLSEKRATAVAAYLKSSGIQAPIEQRGLGKAEEVQTCDGVKAHKKLVECLAPNRRVTIDVHGMGR
jgi:OOP family OmpA-OmpF porin